jgi:DNA-directed RNA polymerase II subunit RPB3
MNSRTIGLEVHSLDDSYINGLRRIMMTKTPTMALDIYKMDVQGGVEPNELLENRLGQYPIKITDDQLDQFVSKKDCKCESKTCSKCSVGFDLWVGNTANKPMRVTTADFISQKPNIANMPSIQILTPHKEIATTDKHCDMETTTTTTKWVSSGHDLLVAVLPKYQAIKMVAYAKKGTGSMNAKWNPMSNFRAQKLSSIPGKPNRNYIEIESTGVLLVSNMLNTAVKTLAKTMSDIRTSLLFTFPNMTA